MEQNDSDEDNLFITQSTFVPSPVATGEACDMYLDIINDCETKDVCQNSPDASSYPAFEDLSSDDDLICTAAVTEFEKETSRINKIVTDAEAQQFGTRSLAANTEKKIQWAVRTFEKWRKERNHLAVFDASISCVNPNLETMTKDELNFCVSRFVCEVTKENGEEYPGQTLYDLVVEIQLFLEQKGKSYKLLSDEQFSQIRNTLDHMMKQRSSAGIGTTKRQAQVITVEEEDSMWAKGVLGMDTPQRLLDSLVYLIGLNFAFRAGMEHRNLRWKKPQLSVVKAENGEEVLRYAEDVSKTNQGGLATRKVKSKIVYAFLNKSHPERCIIRFFRFYTEHCPPIDKRPCDSFYLRPLQKPNGSIWFAASPVGVNTLRGVVARLSKEAALSGHRTNHSLRATAATRLYQAGVPEQVVSEITGHRSEAVRDYKRTNEGMKRTASSVITGGACTETMTPVQTSSKVARYDNSCGPLNITINVNVNK